MSEEIKVGEYVRTKKGEICKVLGVRQEQRADKRVYSHLAYYLDNHKGSLTPAFIVKHSPNIIDLIEVDDYVNNCKVVNRDKNSIVLLTDNGITYLQSIFEGKYIHTIVTHEQFKEMEYRL